MNEIRNAQPSIMLRKLRLKQKMVFLGKKRWKLLKLDLFDIHHVLHF